MNDNGNEIVVRDFSQAGPAEYISEDRTSKGKWRLIDWKSPTDSGKLLFSYLNPTPDITIPLNVKGYYAISLGLYSPPFLKTSIKAKLSGEDKFSEFLSLYPFSWHTFEENTFEEHFWKLADLTEKDLHLSAMPEGSGLAFVRLIPLNNEQIEKLKSPERIEWFWTMDGHGHFLKDLDPPTRCFTDDVEVMSGTDFTTFSWGVIGADLVNYNTQVGTRFDSRDNPTYRELDNDISNNIERLNDVIDTHELAVKEGHKNGFRVFIAQRPQCWSLEPPLDSIFCSKFWSNNRHFACKTADEQSLMQLSFAYPEVRKQLQDVLCEVAQRNPDGVHLIFNRGVPCSLFEQPVLDAFQKEYGQDLRELDIQDPKAVEFRYQYVTTFLRELRQMLPGEIDIAVNCFATRAINDRFGFDIRTWAQEGLVQHMMPNRWAYQRDDYDMDFLREIEESNPDCKFWYYAYCPNVWSYEVLPHEHRARALDMLRKGAKRLAGWDAYWRQGCLNLGHVNELEIWEQISVPLEQTNVNEIGGIVLDKNANPHWGA